jgi:hypothetical protein
MLLVFGRIYCAACYSNNRGVKVTTGDVYDQPPCTTSDRASGRKRQGEKRGRPKKPGPRYANGALKKPTVAQKTKAERLAAAALAEKLPVLKQPHRLGVADRLLESPLGRILIRHNAPRELFTTGVNFGELYRVWSRATGAPSPIVAAAHLITPGKKARPRQAEYWVVTDYNKVEMRLRQSATERVDYAPLVDHSAARSRRADALARKGNKKLRRLRRPLDKAYRVMLGAAEGLRPALRYPAMVLDLVHVVCIDERDLNDPADEPMVLAALLALYDSGIALAPDGPSPDHTDAMTEYEIRLGIYRAAYGVS